jgi:hypothetical protein
MIGSSTVRKDEPIVDFTWGATCASFLARVAKHPSKASATYYLRNHLQYFDGLARSLRELDRVLVPASPCVLVVQSSHYKGVRNDLPTMVSEMGGAQGWTLVERHNYDSSRHMARVHPRAREYRRLTKAIESVLVFRTAA